jgi:hypothetical protein
LFWCRLRGFALIRKYYDWKKSGSEYEFWKKRDNFLPFVPIFARMVIPQRLLNRR